MTAQTTPMWPPLPYEDWEPTKQTLHRFAQIVGKVRMSLVPFRNHWWHVTLAVSARGLTTGPMPFGDLDVEVELDFVDHRVHVRTSEAAGRASRCATACRARASTPTCSPRWPTPASTSTSTRSPSTSATAPRSPTTPSTTATTPTP